MSTQELTPTLEKLRKERSSFMKWTANNTEMDRVERFVVAGQFLEVRKILSHSLTHTRTHTHTHIHTHTHTHKYALLLIGDITEGCT
jgi:hypothetical protein